MQGRFASTVRNARFSSTGYFGSVTWGQQDCDGRDASGTGAAGKSALAERKKF